MSELLPRDVLLRGGGRTLLRYGVPFVSSGGIGRAAEEARETFLRAAPARLYLDRDGNVREAAADVLRVHWPPGVGLPGLLLEHGRQNRIENGDYETDAVGSVANGSTLLRDQTNVRHGSWALKITTTDVGGAGVWFRKRDGTNYLATAGRRYVLAIDVFAPTAAVGKTFHLGMEWKDGTGAQLSTSNATPVALVAGWQRLEFQALAPASTAQVRPRIYADVAPGVVDIWIDLVDFAEAAYAIVPTPTNTAAVTPATDDLVVPVNLGMEYDWTLYLHVLAAHQNLASWADSENVELDPFGLELSPSLGELGTNRTVRLHRQNAATAYEWEWGSNTPSAFRSFTPGTAPQKLVLRHRAADHVLDAAIDGSAFAAAAAPSGVAFVPQRFLRLGNNSQFAARAGNWTLFDLALAKGLRTQAEMEALP